MLQVDQRIEGLTLLLRQAVQRRPEPPVPVRVELPDSDEEDELRAIARERLGYAEGQSFMIEYRDSKGQFSRRRITVWGIVPGAGGIPCLYGRCHERKADRQFRVDRIIACIDYDGEVHEAVPFLCEAFGMDPELAASDESSAVRWKDVMKACRVEAMILAALSHADGQGHVEEVASAARHCARVCRLTGLDISETELLALERHIGRLRPDEAAVVRACDRLLDRSPTQIHGLLQAAVAVIDADGRRHPDEVDLLNDVSLHLCGMPLV